MTLGRFSSLRRPSFVQHLSVSCILLWPSASVRRSVVPSLASPIMMCEFFASIFNLSLSLSLTSSKLALRAALSPPPSLLSGVLTLFPRLDPICLTPLSSTSGTKTATSHHTRRTERRRRGHEREREREREADGPRTDGRQRPLHEIPLPPSSHLTATNERRPFLRRKLQDTADREIGEK